MNSFARYGFLGLVLTLSFAWAGTPAKQAPSLRPGKPGPSVGGGVVKGVEYCSYTRSNGRAGFMNVACSGLLNYSDKVRWDCPLGEVIHDRATLEKKCTPIGGAY